MRSHVTNSVSQETIFILTSFNTASGMRSHVTWWSKCFVLFWLYVSIPQAVWDHMWHRRFGGQRHKSLCFNTASGMRSHVTAFPSVETLLVIARFNTASGMRSHVTWCTRGQPLHRHVFQYRKRYEITCDQIERSNNNGRFFCFNTASGMRSHVTTVSILWKQQSLRFNTASGMRSHVTGKKITLRGILFSFNTASGMRSHVTNSG